MASNDPNKKPESAPDQLPKADAVELPLNEEAGEAFIDFGTVAPIHEGASGVIPLDELPSEISDQSLTSWTEVIRRQRAANESTDEPACGIPYSLSFEWIRRRTAICWPMMYSVKRTVRRLVTPPKFRWRALLPYPTEPTRTKFRKPISR